MTILEEVRARFARDQGLPFADSLTERSILDALDARTASRTAKGCSARCHYLGLPQPGHQRRPQLPGCRVPDHRPPRRFGPRGVFAEHRQLLQRPRPPPRRRPAHLGPADRPAVTGRPPRRVEVERAGRVHRRRLPRLHARRPTEPGGLPAGLQPEAGHRLPAGPGRGAAVAGHGRLPRPGRRAVRRKGHGRDHALAADVRRAQARRRGRRGRPVRQLLPGVRAAPARHRRRHAPRPSAWGPGRCAAGPTATSSSGSARTRRTA